MSCNDIPSLPDLQNTKKHADDFGRLMGTGTGTSTNEVTGQVRPTYNAVMSNLGYTRVGTFATGGTLLNGRQTLLWDIADGGDGQEYGWSGSFLPSGKVVPPGSTPLTTGGIAVGAWMSRFDPELCIQVRESLRRSYAEAGYNLVAGSFEAGGMLTSATDVLLHEASGKAYSGAGPFPQTIPSGTDPASGGFVDRSREIKLSLLYSGHVTESISNPVEYTNSVINFNRTVINVSVDQALRLSGQTSVRDGVVYPTTEYSSMSTLKGEHNEIRNMFINGDGADRFTNVNIIEDAKYTTISRNRYKDQQYHIIQQTGKYANSVTVTENVSTGGIGDFVLANNDSQPGISYDWNASNNIVDQTDSATAYGATECRGIGFTSVYGARAVNNSMIGVRGDAASHVENVQESVFAFNYYRDCFMDFMFSGTSSRNWLIFSSMSGAFNIGEVVTGSSSGATGAVLFSYSQSAGRRVFITQLSGAFAVGENAIGASSGANGIIAFVDNVKTHSNLIGNIFHKSPSSTTLESTNLGVNNYNLCTALVGNTWLSEMSLGVGSRAVNGAFAYNVKQSFGTYRGWDVAIGGGVTAATDYIENFFECNTKHIDLSSLSGARFSGNRFLQGAVNIASSTKVTYENNVFDTGSSLSISAGSGNIWKNNLLASGVSVTAALERFDVFDSKFVQKRGTNVNLTPSPTTITPTAPHTVATITPHGNNVCARVDYKTAWRNTNTYQRGMASGSALLAWDGSGVLTVTEAIVPADNKGRVSFIISGSSVELKLTSDVAGNTIISSDIDVVINGVNVSPIEMFDTL